ncbi:MAG: hypothetical protein A2283_10935 [Lentisphaerae bacterium RIFOXYA12_FULL_48_11]|nr:MAG: hypothetical protein A2283_10935 [Lentisphaerae bacterium RIFOXYA12_FULL_48_11]
MRKLWWLVLVAYWLCLTYGLSAEPGSLPGFVNPIITQGADGSLIGKVESAVIIPGSVHEELWVHPEVMTIPGNPVVIELRARTTDRLGHDKHTTWHYFRTEDLFRTLKPVTNSTATAWKRKDLSLDDLARSNTEPGAIPLSLGHTWCSAYVHVDAVTILQAFTTREGVRYSVQSLLARFERDGLVPIKISNAWSNEKGRGLYEPHIAGYKGRFFMTARAEDGYGYVMSSEDGGCTWNKPKPWTWDSGEMIAMNQTMTKFAAHSDGLTLVYTRIRDDNGKVFRNRSPLHIADVDMDTLSLKRSTERIIVPNRPSWGKGLPVGNFWVWPVSQRETVVTTAEWPRDGRPENGDIWLAKIIWRSPNQLLTPDGCERVLDGNRNRKD